MPTQKPLARIEIRDFPGLVLNLDPADARPGTGREQLNVSCARPATLEVRPGYRVVKFEDS